MKNLTPMILTILLLAACAQQSNPIVPAPATNTQTTDGAKADEPTQFTIQVSNWAFTPKIITVAQGDLVELKFEGISGFHGVGVPEYDIDVKVGAGEVKTVEFLADKLGEFGFRCNVPCGAGHKEMLGTLIVQ